MPPTGFPPLTSTLIVTVFAAMVVVPVVVVAAVVVVVTDSVVVVWLVVALLLLLPPPHPASASAPTASRNAREYRMEPPFGCFTELPNGWFGEEVRGPAGRRRGVKERVRAGRAEPRRARVAVRPALEARTSAQP